MDRSVLGVLALPDASPPRGRQHVGVPDGHSVQLVFRFVQQELETETEKEEERRAKVPVPRPGRRVVRLFDRIQSVLQRRCHRQRGRRDQTVRSYPAFPDVPHMARSQG